MALPASARRLVATPGAEPAAVAPASTPARRRADIQGLRGLAVLLVVIFHGGLPLHGGFVGVDVFFVISGFVITGMLLAELRSTGTLDLRSFYARRIRRLLPALAATSTVVAVLAIALAPLGTQEGTAYTSIAASLFAANGYLYRSVGYFQPGAELNPMLHTWSLSVEEQFYFLFPTLLLLAWRAPGARREPRVRASFAAVVVGAACLLSM